MGILLTVIILSIVVIFHEFGHFILAKKNGIRVNEFAVGMGPKLFGVKKGETEYVLRMLPFGGACVMAGEDEDNTEEGTFNSKSVWARMSVVLAGPIFNFVLAFFFAIFILANTSVTTTEIGTVESGRPADKAGLMAGDEIIRIDGSRVHMFKELQMHRMLNPKSSYEITYKRGGQTYTANVETFTDEDGANRMGFTSTQPIKPNFGQMLKYGYYEVTYNIKLVVKSLGMLVTGQLTKDDVAGPVGMVSIVGDSYNEAKDYGAMSVILTMANIVVILSANLGVMNLIPIPALDGGRFLFLIIEAIKGKPLNRQREGLINFVGFAILMVLMVFILFNDITKLFA